jgi:hypothetical protein
MLRLLTIFAMFLVAGTSPVQAQHQEADPERVAIPAAGLDLVVAIPSLTTSYTASTRRPTHL